MKARATKLRKKLYKIESDFLRFPLCSTYVVCTFKEMNEGYRKALCRGWGFSLRGRTRSEWMDGRKVDGVLCSYPKAVSNHI